MLDSDLIRDGLRRLDLLTRLSQSLRPDPNAPAARVCALESTFYLRNQLLRDLDWASMAHSVELRTPLVDSQLLASLAPLIPYFSALGGKKALARSPSSHLPDDILYRPKSGFSVPIRQWMRRSDPDCSPIAEEKGLVAREWAGRVFRHYEAVEAQALALVA